MAFCSTHRRRHSYFPTLPRSSRHVYPAPHTPSPNFIVLSPALTNSSLLSLSFLCLSLSNSPSLQIRRYIYWYTIVFYLTYLYYLLFYFLPFSFAISAEDFDILTVNQRCDPACTSLQVFLYSKTNFWVLSCRSGKLIRVFHSKLLLIYWNRVLGFQWARSWWVYDWLVDWYPHWRCRVPWIGLLGLVS